MFFIMSYGETVRTKDEQRRRMHRACNFVGLFYNKYKENND